MILITELTTGRKALLASIVLLACSLVACWLYQSISERRDLAKYPPPGKLVDVDSHLMHIYCIGEGTPTVVIEQGLGAISETWRFVQEQSASETRVCTYDRVGMGYSQPVDHPVSSAEVADNLSKLLNAADIHDSLILVGWSSGGIYIREFYRHHSEKVKGMLFVDSSHEQQASRSGMSARNYFLNAAMLTARTLAPLGALRISGMSEHISPAVNSPLLKKHRGSLLAQLNQSHIVAAIDNEATALTLDQKTNKPPRSLGNLPVVVITAGKPIVAAPDTSPAQMETWQRQRQFWNELQLELAALSTSSKHVVAERSGHAIHLDQPELIVQSIGELVSAARTSPAAFR